ncbi:TlpA family protein disulfide reductase [Comamonas terrigena]|uniref:TlpA family protein disulfide reductase n=1 Tax=Comamonas terrigena TaxID=32013 RepID=UPI0024483378|nr:TlpA disulfide reductase family protein [Comamonas terrigena]MDH1703176.1 TlpA family protein disulfide reductase [Comamonas terrigena]
MSAAPDTPQETVQTGRRRWLVAGVAGGAAVAGAGWAWWRSSAAPSPNAVAEQAFWALQLQTPEGAPLALQQFAGKPLLVNFWATWCPPCVRELPLLSRFAQEQPQVQLLGLAVDQAAPVQKFLARQPLAFPVAMAGAGGSTLTRTLGNVTGGLPFSILFDTRGNVKQRKIGELSSADLQQWAQSL